MNNDNEMIQSPKTKVKKTRSKAVVAPDQSQVAETPAKKTKKTKKAAAIVVEKPAEPSKPDEAVLPLQISEGNGRPAHLDVDLTKRFWNNAKLPTAAEMQWIDSFGNYKDLDPDAGKLSNRLTLEVANLRQATQIIVVYHYLHRGRTMAQLPYWIKIDGRPVGVILFAYPRISVPLFGIQPLNLLELARLWIHSSVQDVHVTDSDGKKHAFSVATCAVGTALRQLQEDWYRKYPQLPDVDAVVSWADTVHHEGTIYKAANFQTKGASGGMMHGNRQRPDGGRDQMNPDYAHAKTLFFYPFKNRLPQQRKDQIDRELKRANAQMELKSL